MKNDLVLLRKTRYIELLLTSFQTFCAVIGRNIGHYLQIFRGCVQRTFSSGRILSASWRFAVQGSSEIKVGKIKMHLKMKVIFFMQGRDVALNQRFYLIVHSQAYWAVDRRGVAGHALFPYCCLKPDERRSCWKDFWVGELVLRFWIELIHHDCSY